MSAHDLRTDSGSTTAPVVHTPFLHLVADDLYINLVDQLAPAQRELLAVALAGLGHHLLDQSGSRIGKVQAVLVDRESGRPQWLAVNTRHRREATVGLPTAGLSNAGGHLWTSLDAGLVRSAPIVGSQHISARVEHALCRYYKIPATRGASLGRWERRATCGHAFRDPESPGLIRWLPGPRGDREQSSSQ